MDESEASLGGHKLVSSPSCPWDTAIVIHSRWKDSLRWYAFSCHSVWVGLRAAEEFAFCSAHLPSWVDDCMFEQAIEEVLEAGRSRASGSTFLGVDANCNVDNVEDSRGTLVRDLCSGQGPSSLFQRHWTLCRQSPEGSSCKKKVDFVFTNQAAASVAIAEDRHSRSDHKPLCVTRRQLAGTMLEFARKRKIMAGWFPPSLSQHLDFPKSISQHMVLGSSVGHIQQVLESVMRQVEKERSLEVCEPMTDAERCLHTARCELREFASSGSVHDLNTSSLGKLSPHESMVHDELRMRKRAVADLKARVAAERRLASLRRL